MGQPLLELEDLRIDCEGRCVLEGLALRTSGDRVGLLGNGRYLFDALAGAAEVTSGSLRVLGIDLAQAQRSSVYAVARAWPADANVTLREGLVVSALLGGCTSSAAKQRADRAIGLLGLAQLGRQKLTRRPKVELYLAGLAEAALFEPEMVVIDWPIGLFDPDAWARYGTALARLVQHRRWVALISGPARLPVEQSWIGALDQLLWVEAGTCVEMPPQNSEQVSTLVVIDMALETLPEGLEAAGLRLEPVRLASSSARPRSAFVVALPRDGFGRPVTTALLAWCDMHGLPLSRLEPLDRGY